MSTQINPWKETSPGLWERTTSGYERYFFRLALQSRSLHQPEDYFLLSQIRISPIPTGEAVKEAWRSMRSLQPSLATSWETDGTNFKKTYRAGDDQARADATLITIAQGGSTEYVRNLPIQEEARLLFFPSTGELVLRTPHWAVDARGSLLFWDGFLRQLSSPTTPDGKEVTRLPLTHGDSVGAIPEDKVSEAQKQTTMDRWMEYISGGGPSPIHPRSTAGVDAPGRATFRDAELTQAQTAALVKGCKERGYSVTSAVQAAAILANIAVSENKDGGAFHHNIGVFDFRKYLLPGTAERFPVSLYSTPTSFALPLPTPATDLKFEDTAQFLGKFYKTAFSTEEERRLVNHWFELIDMALSSPEAAAAPPQKDPFTSSIGIIDNYLHESYGKWHVDDFHLMTESTLTSTCIYVYTFRGKLRLVYAYNEALFPEDDILRVLREVKGRLIAEFPEA